MKIFENIIGQPQVVATLKNAVKSARNTDESTQEMTHAWLFIGPPGSGRSIAAACFAAALVCANGGCGECVDCETAISGSHVDVELVRTEGLSIKVDEIRELVSRSSWAPSLGGWRIVILENADRLTEAAANALLKAIEEPTSRTIWILCAPSAIDLLATLRSRCRIISLMTPKKESIVNLLVERDGISSDMAEYAARISQGHIGRAKYFAQNPDSRSRRNELVSLLFNLSNTSDAFKAASEFIRITTEESDSEKIGRDEIEIEELKVVFQSKGRNLISGGANAIKELEKNHKVRKSRLARVGIDNALLDIASLFRDILQVQANADANLINMEFREEIHKLAAKNPPDRVLNIMDSLMQMRQGLAQNGSPAILLEEFFTALV